MVISVLHSVHYMISHSGPALIDVMLWLFRCRTDRHQRTMAVTGALEEL